MNKPVKVIRLAVAVVEREWLIPCDATARDLDFSGALGVSRWPNPRGRELEDALIRTLDASIWSSAPKVGEVISSKRHAYARL